MRIARTHPKLGGLPELRTYDCRTCAVSLTEAVDPLEGLEEAELGHSPK